MPFGGWLVNDPLQPDLLPLPEDEVHLWYVHTNQVLAAQLETLRATLSDDEAERWQRFAYEEGRHQYLVSHGFVRVVLSRYAGVAPSAWRFVRNGYGKPEGAAPHQARDFCFNLTHTRDLAACVVARQREIGVDAEDSQRQGRTATDGVIRRFLSPASRAL